MIASLLLTALVQVGPDPAAALRPGPRPYPADSKAHARMAERLAAIAADALENNLFTGRGPCRRAHEQYAALSPKTPPLARWRVLRELALLDMKIGNPREAAEHLDLALSLLPSMKHPPGAEVVRQVRFDLGVAWLRVGETANCVALHTSQSCIVPIGPLGVHQDQAGSRRAMAIFRELLAEWPSHAAARWLLNLAAMTVGEWPEGVAEPFRAPPELFASAGEFPRLVDVAPERGLAGSALAGGTILDDFDGDDVLDVVTSSMDPAAPLRFYRGLGGGEFEERTTEAGLASITGGLNCLQGDYDNDGWTDVFVPRGGWQQAAGRWPNSLLHNNGNGTFTDVTYDVGLAEVDYPTQTAAFVDYDNDGDLDLFVGNENDPQLDAPCQLFRNDGGRFVDVAKAAGVDSRHYAKAVVAGDVDNDRWSDLYVSNLNGANRLFRNKGDGTFEDVAAKAGVAGPQMSFPAWFWDQNEDGNLDLFVGCYWPDLDTHAAHWLGLRKAPELSAFFQGDGQGRFVDRAAELGVTRPIMPMGANFGDLDLDGWLDAYMSTGYPAYEGLVPNLFFRNVAGKRLLDCTTAAGLGHLQKGHAPAFADLDQDGDIDLYVNVGGAFPGDAFGNALFQNPGNGNHWIEVRAIGVRSNRSAIGARLRVEVAAGDSRRVIHRWVTSGGSFGANPLRQTIGLGSAERVAKLELYWPASDTTQTFEGLAVDRRYAVIEGQGDLIAR